MQQQHAGLMEDIPSFVHILANPSYDPVARRVPSLCWMERTQSCYTTVHRCVAHLPLGESRTGETWTYIPVQWGDVFVAGDILPTFSDTVAKHQLGGVRVIILIQVPDPSGGVPWAEQNSKGKGVSKDYLNMRLSARDLTKPYISRNKCQSM